MNHCRKAVLLFLFTAFLMIDGYSQGIPANKSACLNGAVIDLKDALNAHGTPEETKAHISLILRRWYIYVCYLSPSETIRTQLLGKAEEKRLDKQPGASNTAAGSTSLVNTGSAPWLMGLALEHGGLTQSTDGTTVTLRGNIVNSIRTLVDSTYLGSYKIGQDDPLVQYLSKMSLGVSFDTSSSPASSSQSFSSGLNSFSGALVHYEIYNHRDPRDRKWAGKWDQLMATSGVQLAMKYTNLNAAVRRNDQRFSTWLSSQVDSIVSLPAAELDQQLPPALENVVKSFSDNFWNLPELQAALADFTAGISRYVAEEDTVYGELKSTPIATIEYNFVRQNLPTAQTVSPTQPNLRVPDLSNMVLILERGFAGVNTPELTLNASSTWFNSTAVGRGRLRDARASLQLIVPLRKEIQNIGRFTLSFSAQYQKLFEEPLGQRVLLNGVAINRTGGIGAFQSKLLIPVKGSGVKIPISFTYANRTELIRENDVRGNIGITFDLDSLFANGK